jgi:hypothetical protein
MPVEMDSRAAAEERGYFQQPAALPCEACSACGLCEISTTKIDFMGNISDLSNVNEAEKPKLEMLFKIAGFEQKVQNWDESVGDTGKFEFTRFGRTFKGELRRNGDIQLSVELVQNPALMMEKFYQAQKTAGSNPAEMTNQMQPQRTQEQSPQMEAQSEAIAHIPTVKPKAEHVYEGHVTHIAPDAIIDTAGDQTENKREYTEEEITQTYKDPVYEAQEPTAYVQETQYSKNGESDLERTVLPSTSEYNQWQSEKPFDDWQIIPLRSSPFLDDESTPAASDAVHTASMHEMITPLKPSDNSEFDSTKSVSLPEKYLLTEPTPLSSIPDRENVQSMVETHKHAEREMFNFISEIQAAIEIPENTYVISEESKRDTTIQVETSVSDIHGEAKNIHFVPSNQSEHVIIQYLIAAKARIKIASGQIQFQHTSETTGDISVKEHAYSISHSGKEHTIAIVVKNDATLEIIGTIEALRALGILLLELQLSQTRNAHTNISDMPEMEPAPEERYPISKQSISSTDMNQFIHFLFYQYISILAYEIEQTVILRVYI